MTKAEIIESVLLKVSGGRLSADIDVRREDISVLVDGVLAELLSEEQDRDARRNYYRLRDFGSPGESTISQFAITREITPTKDESRDLYYLDVGGKVYFGAGKNGIRIVKPLKGKQVYRPASSQAVISAIPDEMGVFFFWPENISGVTRVYLSATSTPICNYLIRVYINPSALDDDDELPVPDSILMEAVRRLSKHFIPEYPQDQEITDTDETRAQR
jgi:hypothetical protein